MNSLFSERLCLQFVCAQNHCFWLSFLGGGVKREKSPSFQGGVENSKAKAKV